MGYESLLYIMLINQHKVDDKLEGKGNDLNTMFYKGA
jgi:hypothetical protein